MDIFNASNGEILKIPDVNLSGYVPKNDLAGVPKLSIDSNARKAYASDGTTEAFDYNTPGVLGIGTTTLNGREINQYATSEYEGPTFGPELLDDTGWTSTGWTGSWSTGWIPNNPYTTNTISRTLTLTPGSEYALKITGEVEMSSINIGGYSQGFTISNPEETIIFTAVNSNDLVVVCDLIFSSNVYFSLKLKTASSIPIFSIYDSTNTNTFEINTSLASTKNIGLGVNTLSKIFGGSYNTAIGTDVLYNNTTGLANLGVGNDVLANNTSGNLNIGIGYAGGKNITTGSYNIAIGPNTFREGTGVTGSYNIAINDSALYRNTSGYNNTAIGRNALSSNTSGYNNFAMGQGAMNNNTIGFFNVGIGPFACLEKNTSGSYNFGLGWYALYENTTGTNNVGIGVEAGRYLASLTANANSTYSVFLGQNTKALVANGVNEIVIGYQAVGNGSNTVTLGHTDITGIYLRGNIYPVDGKNIVLGTTTGMKIGTATNQKIGFFNATPIVQVGATIDLGTVLSNLGLRAAGTAYPITTSGATSFTGTINLGGQVTVANGINFAINATTGTKFGTANTQKIGFWNATPVVQPGVYTQTYATATRTHANLTSADIGAFTGGLIGFFDAAERDNLRTQINALRADVTNLKQLVNALIDDHQSIGLAS